MVDVDVDVMRTKILSRLEPRFPAETMRGKVLRKRLNACKTPHNLISVSWSGLKPITRDMDTPDRVYQSMIDAIVRQETPEDKRDRAFIFRHELDKIDDVCVVTPADLFMSNGMPNSKARDLLIKLFKHKHVQVRRED